MKLFKASARQRGNTVAILVPTVRAEHRVRPDKTETLTVVCNMAVLTKVQWCVSCTLRTVRRLASDRGAQPGGEDRGLRGLFGDVDRAASRASLRAAQGAGE
eukprot:6190791-Pleurochrysis_carterae.AAC.2